MSNTQETVPTIDEILEEYGIHYHDYHNDVAHVDDGSGHAKALLERREAQIRLKTVEDVINIWGISDNDEVFFGLLRRDYPAVFDEAQLKLTGGNDGK